jgi:hypothetical protein
MKTRLLLLALVTVGTGWLLSSTGVALETALYAGLAVGVTATIIVPVMLGVAGWVVRHEEPRAPAPLCTPSRNCLTGYRPGDRAAQVSEPTAAVSSRGRLRRIEPGERMVEIDFSQGAEYPERTPRVTPDEWRPLRRGETLPEPVRETPAKPKRETPSIPVEIPEPSPLIAVEHKEHWLKELVERKK